MVLRRFRAATSVQERWGRRFTGAGLLVLGALGGSAAVGLDTSRTVAYQVFSFLLAVVVVSALGSFGVLVSMVARELDSNKQTCLLYE